MLTQVFKDATTFFSRSSSPNLAAVIPAIDHIDSHLTTVSLDAKYKNPIRVACRLAQKTLNKYYSLTDGSIAYRIAMGTSCIWAISRVYLLMSLQCSIRDTS